MSSKKETHFFARPEDGPYQNGRVDELADYARLFLSAAPVRGESSPTYSKYPRHQEVPERILARVPDAKFIYLVRDPIERIVSQYMHRVAMGGVRRSFADDLGDLADPYNGYVCASRYAFQLDRFLRLFPQDRVMVVDNVDLRTSRRRCLEAVFRFLEVDSTYWSPGFDTEHGVSSDRRRYAPGYVGVADRLTSSPMRRLMPTRARRPVRRAVERMLWPPLEAPVVSDELRQRLAVLLTQDVDRLRNLTGQTFGTWSV